MFSYNQKAFNALFNLAHRSPVADFIYTAFAEYFIYAAIIVFILVLKKEKEWVERYMLFSVAALSAIISRGIITPLIRFAIPMDRPFATLPISTLIGHDISPSFPSGHISFLVPLSLAIFFANKKVGTYILVGTAMSGVARVISGVHWPIDIIAAVIVGIIGFAVAYKAIGRAKRGAALTE